MITHEINERFFFLKVADKIYLITSKEQGITSFPVKCIAKQGANIVFVICTLQSGSEAFFYLKQEKELGDKTLVQDETDFLATTFHTAETFVEIQIVHSTDIIESKPL